MPPRSCSSCTIVCLNALPSTPTRLAAGTRTSREVDLAEVAVGRHVGDRTDLDARRVHRHDDLADALDAVAPTSRCDRSGSSSRRRSPKLVQIFWPLITKSSPSRTADGGQRREIRTGVRFGHSDAPRRVAGEHRRQELGLLIGGAVARSASDPSDDRRTTSQRSVRRRRSVPRRRSSRSIGGRPPPPNSVGQHHADPAQGRQFLGEVLREPVDPRVVVASVAFDRLGGDLAGLRPKFVLFIGPGEVHRP